MSSGRRSFTHNSKGAGIGDVFANYCSPVAVNREVCSANRDDAIFVHIKRIHLIHLLRYVAVDDLKYTIAQVSSNAASDG